VGTVNQPLPLVQPSQASRESARRLENRHERGCAAAFAVEPDVWLTHFPIFQNESESFL
jgi:hypothetical protein